MAALCAGRPLEVLEKVVSLVRVSRRGQVVRPKARRSHI